MKIILPLGDCSTLVTSVSTSSPMRPRRSLDHDHRAVVEVADALLGLLALADDLDAQRLARQHRRLERVREVVDVEHAHALDLRDLVEVVVGRQDRQIRARGRRARAWRRRRRRRAPTTSGVATGCELSRRSCTTSRPRRPRARRCGSVESATRCNSCSTNTGITSSRSTKPVEIRSPMRPSMMAEVSTSMASGCAWRAGRSRSERSRGRRPSRVLVGPQAAQTQDRAVAASADDREQVPEHERQRQQQVAPDVRQRPHGERRQRRGAEAEHEPNAADDQLARRDAPVPPVRPSRSPVPEARRRSSRRAVRQERRARSRSSSEPREKKTEDGREGRLDWPRPGCLQELPGGRRPASRSASRSALLLSAARVGRMRDRPPRPRSA